MDDLEKAISLGDLNYVKQFDNFNIGYLRKALLCFSTDIFCWMYTHTTISNNNKISFLCQAIRVCNIEIVRFILDGDIDIMHVQILTYAASSVNRYDLENVLRILLEYDKIRNTIANNLNGFESSWEDRVLRYYLIKDNYV